MTLYGFSRCCFLFGVYKCVYIFSVSVSVCFCPTLRFSLISLLLGFFFPILFVYFQLGFWFSISTQHICTESIRSCLFLYCTHFQKSIDAHMYVFIFIGEAIWWANVYYLFIFAMNNIVCSSTSFLTQSVCVCVRAL